MRITLIFKVLCLCILVSIQLQAQETEKRIIPLIDRFLGNDEKTFHLMRDSNPLCLPEVLEKEYEASGCPYILDDRYKDDSGTGVIRYQDTVCYHDYKLTYGKRYADIAPAYYYEENVKNTVGGTRKIKVRRLGNCTPSSTNPLEEALNGTQQYPKAFINNFECSDGPFADRSCPSGNWQAMKYGQAIVQSGDSNVPLMLELTYDGHGDTAILEWYK